jgi:hypothetical protein
MTRKESSVDEEDEAGERGKLMRSGTVGERGKCMRSGFGDTGKECWEE